MIVKKTGVMCIVMLLLVSVLGVSVGITGSGTFEEEVGANNLMDDVIEIHTWEDLHNMQDDLAGNYTLMNDLTLECEGYLDYNEQRDDHTTREYAGWGETWKYGDTIDIPFDEDEYDSVLSVEDGDGNPVAHTVDDDVIIIDEYTGEMFLYVNYEDALLGWMPVGDSDNSFTGNFDGANHTITGLYINRPSTSGIGLFRNVDGGEVHNVGLVDADVSGTAIYTRVGGLVGINLGGRCHTRLPRET